MHANTVHILNYYSRSKIVSIRGRLRRRVLAMMAPHHLGLIRVIKAIRAMREIRVCVRILGSWD